MYLYEDNYYDAIRLYILLTKKYDKNTEIDKINAIYLKISDIFIHMKETKYIGTEDEDFNSKINKKLKKWYEIRFDIAQEYYDKANMTQEGYKNIGNYLCSNNNFDLGLDFYKKLEDLNNSKKMIKECQKLGAEY
jgi:tetratricopeptide (TPR) repeat protein